jgi:molybdopterin molybdotransferase
VARQADLLSVEDALERILRRFGRLEAEIVALGRAHGRVTAEPVRAPMNLPPFTNSSMDGFAVRSADTAGAAADSPVELLVGATIAAGSGSETEVPAGGCARIMTGAPLPPGADAVVPFEDVDEADGRIRVSAAVRTGACVRRAGQDTAAEREVLPAGTELNAPQLALLAALGLDRVAVVRRPLIAVLATGNELVAPGTPLRPGEIYNSNAPMLGAAIVEAGGEPSVLPAAGDDPEAIAAALARAGDADLILTSGGASVGDFDHVKDIVGRAGNLTFWRVRVRPGKPLIFGTVGGAPLIGLPGNPTSAMVTFELFARPAIRTMLGASLFRPRIEVVIDEPMENRGGRRTYARVRLRYGDGRWHATPAGPQDSAMLVPLARADGLLEMREEQEELRAGDVAPVLIWRLPE